MYVIFSSDGGVWRATGHTSVEYSNNAENDTIIETTEGGLESLFQSGVDAGVDTLAGTGDAVEAAIKDPLAYRDFLVLEDGEIVFDDGYSRPSGEA